jgi:LAO/AO transport system kinase
VSNIPELLKRIGRRDRLALARALSLATRSEPVATMRRMLDGTARGQVVAITGSGGVGKSSLIGKLIELLRRRDKTVAVLACDPQSPLTGGALLGDRIRMSPAARDERVFIRSISTAAGRQGIIQDLDVMIGLLFAYGFDTVLLETVGAGQGDTAVRDIADVLILLLQPESGDDLQWEKAGLLEVADIVAVNKSDLPGAEAMQAQIVAQLNLPGCREIPVLRTSPSRDEGIEELWNLVESLPGKRSHE